MKASPMPVLPEVGSTRVVFPGWIFPASSAPRIMLSPILRVHAIALVIWSSLVTGNTQCHLEDSPMQRGCIANLL
jgi:hypothetical protein